MNELRITYEMIMRLSESRGLRLPYPSDQFTYEDEELKSLLLEMDSLQKKQDEIYRIIRKRATNAIQN